MGKNLTDDINLEDIDFPEPDDNVLIPEHIRDCWSQRIKGNEKSIDDGYYELTFKDTVNGRDIPICGSDKLLLVKGPEGSRKSLFTSCLCTSAFIDWERFTLGFTLRLPPDRSIIHFDTEMDKQDVKERKMMFNNICHLEPDDDHHMVFSVEDYTYTQRAEVITHIIKNAPIKPGVIVIDQVADLMPHYDVNDTTAAGMVMEMLLQWKRMTKAMIICNMHTNRGGTQTNGILGKNLDHKIFGSFLTEYNWEDHTTTIKHFKSRKRKIKNLRIKQDEVGLPKLLLHDEYI